MVHPEPLAARRAISILVHLKWGIYHMLTGAAAIAGSVVTGTTASEIDIVPILIPNYHMLDRFKFVKPVYILSDPPGPVTVANS